MLPQHFRFQVQEGFPFSYSYITGMSLVSLLLHETEGEARAGSSVIMISTNVCDITGLYLTTFDHK